MADNPTGKRYRMTKMVEARRLNPNSGIPLTEPPTALPFGATLENVREERDLFKFTYLGKPYQCLQSILRPAMEPFGGGSDAPAEASTVLTTAPDALPPPVQPVESATPAPFQWETVPTSHGPLLRAKLPGGWLLMTGRGAALSFYPDPQHKWDGATLP